jgi:hypothetical protein
MVDTYTIFKRQQITLTLREILKLDMYALYSGILFDAYPVLTWQETTDKNAYRYYNDYLDTIDGLRKTVQRWRQA